MSGQMQPVALAFAAVANYEAEAWQREELSYEP